MSKDRVMQELQRFGGAMYTPVILFAFFGLTVAISIICKNTMLLGCRKVNDVTPEKIIRKRPHR